MPFLKAAFPLSRSLAMLADRLGFTGIGGGGIGVSRVRIERWRAFKVASSSLRGRDEEVVDMALELGSIWRARRVNVSVSSMMMLFRRNVL